MKDFKTCQSKHNELELFFYSPNGFSQPNFRSFYSVISPQGIARSFLFLIRKWEFKTQPAFTCSKLTIDTLRTCRLSGVFIVNFEHISHLVLVFLLLTLNMQLPAGNMRKLRLMFLVEPNQGIPKEAQICPSVMVQDVLKDVWNSLECKIKIFRTRETEIKWFLYFPNAYSQSNYRIPW